MIPVSLLLILVAVTLLVLGLTGGSSSLLISSIVTSLLAALALVIGARQAVGVRRAGEIPEPAPDFAGPGFATPEPAATDSPYADASYADAPYADSPYAAEPEFVAESQLAEAQFAAAGEDPARRGRRHEAGATDDLPAAGDAFAGDSATSPQRDTVQFDPVAADEQGDLSADEAGVATRRASSAFGEPDEFGEPDADDPDDEPLPQSVRPADAVRIARLDAEVLVVDGRPRYHVPECTHLVGRLTEPVPVNEAVELGFSPCGLCRPVDRLVTELAALDRASAAGS